MPSSARESSIVVLTAAATSGVLGLAWWWQRRQPAGRYKSVPLELSSNNPYIDHLRVAVKLALEAGANIKQYCETVGTAVQAQDLNINTKGQPEDFCTAIDILNEELVGKGISAKFPSHKIIGEESTGTGVIPSLSKDPTWIIDPIDGTTNFASGLPLSCVSIGYCEEGKPVLGVVYAPMLSELYVAVRGHGAYLNGIRLVTGSLSKQKTLSDAIVVFELGYTRSKQGIETMLGALQRVLNHGFRAVRGFGSGVLDLCHVARGSIDVVYAGVAGEGWKPWDHCAGTVIVTEAGCVIESLIQDKEEEVGDFDIYSDSIICAVNKDILNTCRNLVCDGL